MVSDCTQEAFRVIGTGPLVSTEGSKVGAIYPALNVYSVYSDTSAISQSWAQSSSLLVGLLESPLPTVRCLQITAVLCAAGPCLKRSVLFL